MLVGFIISLVFTAVGGPAAYEWPTPEMAGRGKPMAILENVFITAKYVTYILHWSVYSNSFPSTNYILILGIF